MLNLFKTRKLNNLITIIDIGSSKITCLIAKINEQNGEPEVIGNSQNISKGFKLGNVINIENLSTSIAKAVSSSEKMAGVSINKAHIVFNGGKQSSTTFDSETPIVNGEINDNEIQKIISNCIHNATKANYKLLHAIPIKFYVDESAAIKNPKGMVGHILKGKVNICKINESTLSNIARIVERNHIEIESFISSTYANGFSSLNKEEMRLGCALIDIGASTTSIGIFHDDSLIYSFDIPLGGYNVTNDIASGLATTLQEAEKIKVLHGNLYNSTFSSNEQINIASQNQNNTNSYQTVSIGIINEIIKARVSEIFELIEKHLKIKGYDHFLKTKVVFTGGSSQITGLEEISKNLLSRYTRVSLPVRVNGLPDAACSPNFATVIGGLLSINRINTVHNNNINLNEKLNSFQKLYRWMATNV